MERTLLLNIVSLVPIIVTVRLTLMSWYEREDEAASLKTWIQAVLVAGALTLSIMFLYDAVFTEELKILYKIVTIWEFVTFAYVASLFSFWYVKKIDKIFILLSISAFSALFMFLSPLIFLALEARDVSIAAIISFGFGGFIGSSVAVGVNKEIRKGDLLASLSTFIQIFTLGETVLEYLYSMAVISRNIYLSLFIWFITFILGSVYYSRKYLKQ